MKGMTTRLLALGLACTLAFAPACGDDDHDDHDHTTDTVAETDTTTTDDTGAPDDSGTEGPGNLAEVATAAGNFTTLLAAVDAAGLTGVVATSGPFTIFAPTDEAFAKLPEGTVEDLLKEENKDQLTGILTYHVVNGTVGSEEVVTLTEAETLAGATIAIEVVDGKVILNGSAEVTATDIEASNGVIHVIDTVLMPPTPEPEVGNIAEVATEAGVFSTLLAAVDAADLSETLATGGPFTVLAPTDDAFAALPEGKVDDLLKEENKDELVAILKYHLIEGTVGSETVVTLDEAATLQGEAVSIEVVDGKVVLNGSATVTTADVAASNGVIHIIDAVLMPPSMTEPPLGNIAEVATANGSFTTLLTAVEAAGLTDTLATGGPFTVLAPTDDAFAALPDGTLDSLLTPEKAETLTAILKYHLLDGEFGSDVVVTLDEAETLQGEKITIEVVDGKVVLNGTATVEITDVPASNGVIHVINAVILPPSIQL